MKVGVIGAGAWGTALAISSARVGNSVTLWSYDGLSTEFDGVVTPENIKITQNSRDLNDSEAWLIVTPAAFFRETIRKFKDVYAGQTIIICTKGIEVDTNKFMSEIISEELPECKNIGVLSGPQYAGEVAQGVPTGSTLAGTSAAINSGAMALAGLYLEHSDDIIGAEICGVGKNAVALIAGYISVTSAGENERALIFTRAWGEVVALGLAYGARIETFLGLCGVGDLFLTATSKTSRNYSGGVSIANGDKAVGTVEGISALNGLVHHGKIKNVAMPVMNDMQLKMNL